MNLSELQQKLINKIAESPFATGFDLSKWNDSFDIDTKDIEIILQVLDHIALRIGFGGTQSKVPWEDIKFREFWEELKQHPEIIRMLYWYYSSETPWELQRDKTFEILDSLNGEWEIFWLDLEIINNKKSAGFALTAIRFLKALKARYPDKLIGIYTNKYNYQGWFRFYSPEFDKWILWIAQYPWSNWVTSISSYFVNWWGQVFTTLTKRPPLPTSRDKDDWELWQVGDKTGIGKFFGLGSVDVDINISRRLLEDFIKWIGKLNRGVDNIPDTPDPDIPEDCNEQDEKLTKLFDGLNEMDELVERLRRV